MTWRFVLVALLAPLALALGAAGSRAEPSVHELEFVIERPDSVRVQLQFAVSAANEQQAVEAALAATHQLVPGARILEDGSEVSAQFASWWWQWDASELPVAVAYNPAGAPFGVSAADLTRGLEAWSSVESSSFAFRFAGATSSDVSVHSGVNDGVNVVAWRHLDCRSGCVLGVTSKTELHEADIILNTNPEAKLGDGSNGTVDTATVMLHELGHAAGLEHSCPMFQCTPDEQSAVMYFQYRGPKHDLQPDDIAGISALYPSSDGVVDVHPEILEITLEPGWMLTVLPPGPMEEAMRELGCVQAAFAFDDGGWLTWFRGAPPTLQDIRQVAPGAAYWLYASTACSHLFVLD